MRITKRDRRAWAAGFLDGEGCIGIYTQHERYVLNVSASQSVREPLEILLAMYGGSIHADNRPGGYGGRGVWAWRISGQRAADALIDVVDFLVVKRGQAEIALEFFSSTDRFGKDAKRYADKLKAAK